ncbi:MAG: divK [Cyanobacteria bacterium RYN_339]|nr:divK [Cyanobacteria bacterium RYN_339]
MRVLVVEDNPHSAELMVLRLATLGCESLVAASAEEGFTMAHTQRPDVILLDLKLDGDRDGGVALLGRLREDPRTANIRVVIHSIYVAHPDEMPRLEHQADGMLLKPFKFKDLKELIEGFRTPRPGA